MFDLLADDIISNLNEIETLLGDETSNNDSESISLTEGLNEMKTFFSSKSTEVFFCTFVFRLIHPYNFIVLFFRKYYS